MNLRLLRFIVPALCGILSSACDDPLVDAQRIEGTRVLAAHVEVEDEPARVSPRPSERTRVTWLVADPDPSPALGWAFGVCAARATTRGVPGCRLPPFASFSSQGLNANPPEIEFDTPEDAALAGAEKLLVYGAICRGNEPVLSDILEQTRCASERTLVVLEVPIERGAANLNPRFAEEPLTLDGRPWLEASPASLARVDCASADGAPELPVVTADHGRHSISIAVDGTAREVLPASVGQGLEELWLSSFSTGGRLARALSEVDGASPAAATLLDWQAPSAAPSGQVARFYFVLRDLRGGSVWALRTACVVP